MDKARETADGGYIKCDGGDGFVSSVCFDCWDNNCWIVDITFPSLDNRADANWEDSIVGKSWKVLAV